MKKTLLLLIMLPVLCLFTPTISNAQKGVNALMNVVETLQFLRDIKENKGKIEEIARKVKTKHQKESSEYATMKEKYDQVKLTSDNILNSMVIDLMDAGKRRLYIERPSLMEEFYGEGIKLYNKSVSDFNEAYLKTEDGKMAGLGGLLKDIVKALVGELINVTKKIAIEILIEKLKAPYTMKYWSEA